MSQPLVIPMTNYRSTSFAILTAAVLALPASSLWDAAGHRTVAAIAWERMTPRARARAVALAWLLHLVGDIHQPLHCSSRVSPDEPLPHGDAGGNTFRLDDDRNLHGYWDRILDEAIAPEPGEDSIAYASRIAQRSERTEPRVTSSADVSGWAQEGLRIAQTVVYAGVSRGTAPSADYEAEALRVSEGRIALAGYRLAALLNEALK